MRGKIQSETELYAILMPAINLAIKNVCDRLLVQYKSVVENIIYSRSPSTWYSRQHEFDKQWAVVSKGITGYATSVMIDFFPDTQLIVPSEHKHSQWGLGIGESFAQTIFEGYEVFNTGVMIEARDAWSVWQKKYATITKISSMFRGEMRKLGLPIKGI